MIRTQICDIIGIEHPIVLGGMASPSTSALLVAAVSNAGGLGTLGVTGLSATQVTESIAAIRSATEKPFGINYLLFRVNEDGFAAGLAARPSVVAFAWARSDQDLQPYIQRVHDAGLLVMYMAGHVSEAVRAAESGADIIVAQGTEGGGHVGWMASMVLLPMILDAVAPLPVLMAGGVADGRGLAAALALGADGVLLGTRFLATEESPIHPNFKQAIVDSDGHDTVISELPDVANGTIWPGAMSRAKRNRFFERWSGQEWLMRQAQGDVSDSLAAARAAGDVENAILFYGQDSGLINTILPAHEVISSMVSQAEEIIAGRMAGLISN